MSIQTAEDVVLHITRTFDAPPERVFDAWLQREQFQAWIGPEGTQSEVPVLEARVGGRYRIVMNMSDGSKLPVVGVFKAIDRPHGLIFTWGWEGDSRESLVTVSFRDLGGKTEMALRHDGLETMENRDAHGGGWNSTLNKLAAYVSA